MMSQYVFVWRQNGAIDWFIGNDNDEARRQRVFSSFLLCIDQVKACQKQINRWFVANNDLLVTCDVIRQQFYS